MPHHQAFWDPRRYPFTELLSESFADQGSREKAARGARGRGKARPASPAEGGREGPPLSGYPRHSLLGALVALALFCAGGPGVMASPAEVPKTGPAPGDATGIAAPSSADGRDGQVAARGDTGGNGEEVRYLVERIRILGNRGTKAKIIRAKLGIREGDPITPTDPRVEDARLALLASGLFREVSFELARGSRSGYVDLLVRVVERGSIVVQALQLNYSDATPFWGGLDLAENNFLGRGLHLSGALVIGGASRTVGGSRLQHGERLRFSYPSLLFKLVGLSAVLLHNEASDYFRLRGSNPDGADLENFAAVVYRRVGGTLGVFSAVGRLNRVSVDYRLEGVHARLPVAAVREYPDGRQESLRFDLGRDWSFLSSFLVMFARDTRNDPSMPSAGMRLEITGELATRSFGSSYSFAKLAVSFQKHWLLPWKRHGISLHLFTGVIIGDSPLFNKFFIGDFSELVPSRALELNFSTRPTRNLLSNSIEHKRYETMAGRAAVSYHIPLSKGTGLVYGSDFYVSLGLITLLSDRDFRFRDQGLRRAIPVDLTFDLGFRLDTYVGVFKLSFGNALGWIPR